MDVRLYSYWCEFRAEELIGFDPETHELQPSSLEKYPHLHIRLQEKELDLQPFPKRKI